MASRNPSRSTKLMITANIRIRKDGQNTNGLIFSNINFPIGEVLYIAIFISFIYLVFKTLSFKFKDFLNLISFISIVYFFFYSFWGLNYFRTSISERLNIKSNYEFVELDSTIEKIISQIEKEISLIKNEKKISNIFELIDTKKSNIKESIIPDLFLYQRVSGHFIPFTSEAVVVKEIPLVDIPVVILHEQAHQMGYADEGEASFIAFTNAIKHKDPSVRYSGYFNALMNLLNEVVKNHPEKLEFYKNRLDEKVLSDISSVQNFWGKYSDNIFDKITNFILNNLDKVRRINLYYLKIGDQINYSDLKNYDNNNIQNIGIY